MSVSTGSTTPVASVAYSAQGFPSTMKDSWGLTTRAAYDSSGSPTSVVDPMATSFSSDSAHRIAAVTDTNGMQATFSYDSMNRVSKIDEAINNRTYSTTNAVTVNYSGIHSVLTKSINITQISSVDSFFNAWGDLVDSTDVPPQANQQSYNPAAGASANGGTTSAGTVFMRGAAEKCVAPSTCVCSLSWSRPPSCQNVVCHGACTNVQGATGDCCACAVVGGSCDGGKSCSCANTLIDWDNPKADGVCQ